MQIASGETLDDLHSCRIYGADEGVLVGLFGECFPFVDGSAAAFGADEVLGGDLFGEQAVLVGMSSDQLIYVRKV